MYMEKKYIIYHEGSIVGSLKRKYGRKMNLSLSYFFTRIKRKEKRGKKRESITDFFHGFNVVCALRNDFWRFVPYPKKRTVTNLLW